MELSLSARSNFGHDWDTGRALCVCTCANVSVFADRGRRCVATSFSITGYSVSSLIGGPLSLLSLSVSKFFDVDVDRRGYILRELL